jgi:hypothetical protein
MQFMAKKKSDKRSRSRRGSDADADAMFPLALPDGALLSQERRERPDRRLDGISVEFHDEVEDVRVAPIPARKDKK